MFFEHLQRQDVLDQRLQVTFMRNPPNLNQESPYRKNDPEENLDCGTIDTDSRFKIHMLEAFLLEGSNPLTGRSESGHCPENDPPWIP